MCVVYRVISMLIYFEPAGKCDFREKGLVLAPLPARKTLWEATDEIAWHIEREGGRKFHPDFFPITSDSSPPASSAAFGLTANGQLVKVDLGRGQHYCSDYAESLCRRQSTLGDNNPSPSTFTVDLDDWCTGMDGLGGLVMLAASLLE